MSPPARAPALKLGVLGLLVERRGYGYELKQRLERRAGSAWQTSQGAIYEALRHLEGEDLVRSLPMPEPAAEATIKARRGSRRILYEITPAGEECFSEWISGPCAFVPARDDLHLRLVVSRAQDLPRLIEITTEHERECLQLLDGHRNGPAFEDLIDDVGALEAFASVAVRDAQVIALEGTVDWLRNIRKTMRWMVDNPERFLKRRE